MLRKDLYLQIYKRFANLYNFCVDKNACEDILEGERLFFGICPKYHPKYKDEWLKLVTPLFLQDVNYIFKKLGCQREIEWNVDEVMHAIKNDNFVSYVKRRVPIEFYINKFFELYKESSLTTINL